ncbi:MAG TPA: hypothetical protein VGM06_20580 [Polyangiaceae bacterium]|jgi:hypothetical protein
MANRTDITKPLGRSPVQSAAANTSPVTLGQFWTPANVQDLSDNPPLQTALNAQWSANLDGFTRQGIVGNPWNATYASNQTSYFNPLGTPVSGAGYAPIAWGAFPGRINAYFPSLSATQQLQLGDYGYYTDGKGVTQTFGHIPQTPMAPVTGQNVPYGPYGPRGWQDEYCEWSVTRNAKGQITRIDFTCENPEYWNTLWMVSPDRVLALYRSTLRKPQIALADLYLTDANGNPVIDPSTGRPAYNGLNKWNRGPISNDTQGGAMHLTSTPNTIQTEIGLASAATVQRQGTHATPDSLICCAQYGQRYRNSDPNIGFQVNSVVGEGASATLANPPGLYIQTPNFGAYKPPVGHEGDDVSQFWTVTRGTKAPFHDAWGNQMPGDFILHATFEVPASKGYTVSDITITTTGSAQAIIYGGQVAQTFHMQIVAWAYPAPIPAAQPCVGSLEPSFAQPLQLFHQNVFNACSGQGVSTVDFAMNLLGNTTLIAPLVEQGSQSVPMVISASVTIGDNDQLPTVTFDGVGVTATVVDSIPVTYAIPGNTYPSTNTALTLSVNVAANATLGLRTVYVTNAGQTQGVGLPAVLHVVPAGSIAASRARGAT